MKWFAIAIGALASAYLGFKIGVTIGEANSGVYSPELVGFRYMLANAHLEKSLSGHEQATLVAGWKRYIYDPTKKVATYKVVPSLAVDFKPRRKWTASELDKFDALTGASMVTEGGLAATFLKVAAPEGFEAKSAFRWEIVALITVATLGGGYVGYLAGKKDDIDLTDPRFEQQLLDINNWSAVYDARKSCDEAVRESQEQKFTIKFADGKTLPVDIPKIVPADRKQREMQKICEKLAA